MVPAPGVVELCPFALPRLGVSMQQRESRCTEFGEIRLWNVSLKLAVVSKFG
jgi:hypothetical protein